MKRTPLKRIGKIGKANLEANKILREKLGHVTYCELQTEKCMGNWPLQFVHRHKRLYYQGNVEKLSDINQVAIGCQTCHDFIENNAELTEQIFQKIRGGEGN